jgi:general secretion pathway protein J
MLKHCISFLITGGHVAPPLCKGRVGGVERRPTAPRSTSPSPSLQRRGTVRGFTLLEVLIALSILAIIFALIYGTLDSTQKLAKETEGESDLHRQAQIALVRMSAEFSMLYWPRPAGGVSTSGLFVGEDETRFDSRRESQPSDSVRFLALSHGRLAKNAPEGDLVEVTYLLDLDQDLLIRQEEFAEGGRSMEIPLAEGVLGLNFRYFDGQSNTWVDGWDSQQAGRAPEGVEITLILKDSSEKGRSFVTMTDLPMGRGKG